MRKAVLVLSPSKLPESLRLPSAWGYAGDAFGDSLSRGEAPYSPVHSHRFDGDAVMAECALAHLLRCDLVAVYDDHGQHQFIKDMIHHAGQFRRPVEYRQIGQERRRG